MNAIEELLKELEKRGITPRLEAGRLRSYARRGSLTEDLDQRIREHKMELIARLDPDASPPEAAASQTGPAAEPPLPEPAESEPAPQAATLPPEGRVGEHRAPGSTCGDTWCWPAVSSETGELG